MKFLNVARVFDEIEKETSRLKITKLLADLLKQASLEEAAIISYLSLGRLDPVYVSSQFNFAEKSIVKVLATLFNVKQKCISNKSKNIGDLGLVVEAIDPKLLKSENLSVQDISIALREFLDISGIGSQDEKEKMLLSLLRRLEPISAKYVIRIIVGKLRLGFLDMTLLDAFSWMDRGDKSIRDKLEEAYNVSADIGLIAKILKEDGMSGIDKISVSPGVPVRPAAAERLKNADAIIKKIGAAVAQPKLDGLRLQIHIKKNKEVSFFSRNLQDMSHMFPDLKNVTLKLKIKNFIADGEAIAYDPETESFLPFQDTVKRKRKYKIEQMVQEFPLKLFIFDILFLDSKSMLNKPHKERRHILLELFKESKIKKKDDLAVIEEKTVKTAYELEAYFAHNISQGLEGIVVKRIDAIYTPGKRNFNWIKLKRKEAGNLDDTIDCVILGYYAGRGKRAEFGIGALLVGIYNQERDSFQTVAKIGTGLSDAKLREQKKQCDKIAVKEKPKNVDCAKELYPDVWITPEIVCLIRADEITRSPLHTAGKDTNNLGLALRFPRFMKDRQDKNATEVTTVKELETLFNLQFNKRKIIKDVDKKQPQEKVKNIFDV